MKPVLLKFFLISFLYFISCEKNLSSVADSPQKEVRPLSVEEQILVETDQKFSIKLFKSISSIQSDSNMFISPLSVSMALGMTMNGAAGQTYEDMKSTLEFNGLTEDEINNAYRSLIDLLTGIDEKVLFKIANSIWAKKGFPVESAFIETNKTYFDAEVAMLDFSLPSALEIINGWVAQKTHDKITKVLDRIPADVVMYLINAIYFKAMWQYEFDKDFTEKKNFYLSTDDIVETDMMMTTADLNYYQDSKVQIVDLPYGQGNFTMTVFLPQTVTDLDEFIENLDVVQWNFYLNQLEIQKGTVSFPKLKIEYKLLMNDVLKQLGMGIAFGSEADFSRISPGRDLAISRVIHQTFVQVDEEGTEAAAVTVVEIWETSAQDPELDFVINLNRPFLFVIREKETGTVLFMGKIVRPSWEE